MNAPVELRPAQVARFRTKLLVSMMLVVTAVTGSALFLAQRSVAENAKREAGRDFAAKLAALRAVQDVRHAALAERCRVLARKARIHAALEDNALDLLYPSAREELLDLMRLPGQADDTPPYSFHARFYRFLDGKGRVIPPAATADAGAIPAELASRLALPGVPARVQTGFLPPAADRPERVDEVIVMPILSSESGEPIAALLLGFAPFEPAATLLAGDISSGIWTAGTLYLPALAPPTARALAAEFATSSGNGTSVQGSFETTIDGVRSQVIYKQLNPGSLYPPAFEVSLYPLTESLAQQRRLRWQFGGAGLLLLLGAFGASHAVSRRLARPVEELAADSVVNLVERRRAEEALEHTSEELQRSARFSADASHQLRTPVTILRIGLEELLAAEKLKPETREEISALVHQTFRLTSIIEDLLLLSRVDAGRLQLDLGAVDLAHLINSSLDDLGALPDEAGVAVETDFPDRLQVLGEQRYTSLILQNLLENARKYNRPGGRIRLEATVQPPWVVLVIGNTGQPIPPEAHDHIFERFHRGASGGNIPGHGLGLNLARELARLHRGELRLVRSADDWTEFEVRFALAGTAGAPVEP